MKKYLFAACFLAGLVLQGHATCTVYFYTGKVDVILKNNAVHTLSAINEVLDDNTKIKLGTNAEVILKNAAGQFAIIHAEGLYDNTKIGEEFKEQQGKSLVASLAGFLGTQLTKGEPDIRKTAESYMKQKGGVTRGNYIYPLMQWPAASSITDSTDIMFTWNAVAKKDSYEIIIYSGADISSDVKVGRAITADTFMDVNFKDFGVDKDAYFSWVVYPKGEPNYLRFAFRIESANEYKKEVDAVEHEAELGTSPEDKLLIKASGFEKNGLIALADKTYRQLLATGNNETYKDLYLLFKLRNNLAI